MTKVVSVSEITSAFVNHVCHTELVSAYPSHSESPYKSRITKLIRPPILIFK